MQLAGDGANDGCCVPVRRKHWWRLIPLLENQRSRTMARRRPPLPPAVVPSLARWETRQALAHGRHPLGLDDPGDHHHLQTIGELVIVLRLLLQAMLQLSPEKQEEALQDLSAWMFSSLAFPSRCSVAVGRESSVLAGWPGFLLIAPGTSPSSAPPRPW